MDNCLLCEEELILQINWGNLIRGNKQSNLCAICNEKLEFLNERQCFHCSRPADEEQCEDCKTWSSIHNGNDPLFQNVSLYTYNSFMKDVITRWKYRGDYIISEIFREDYSAHFQKRFAENKKQAVIVPIPLSRERLYERGFNQAHLLATFLTTNVADVLKRVHNEKQAKKSRMERMTTTNPFSLQSPVNQPVILIDDIYTTGSTLRHAATILKANGCPQVFAYTLIRG